MESPKRGCDLGPCVVNASVKKRIAIVFCDLKTSLSARACVCVQKTRRFAFAFLNPLSSCPAESDINLSPTAT